MDIKSSDQQKKNRRWSCFKLGGTVCVFSLQGRQSSSSGRKRPLSKFSNKKGWREKTKQNRSEQKTRVYLEGLGHRLSKRFQTADPGAPSDALPGRRYSNHILDEECSRSIKGIASAKVLCKHLKITATFESLHCKPFFYSYGQQNSDFAIKIGIWKLPIQDWFGTFEAAELMSFYVTEGDGLTFLRNKILHTSHQLEKENILCLSAGTMKISYSDSFLQTHTDSVLLDVHEVCTYLVVVALKNCSYSSFCSTFSEYIRSASKEEFAKTLREYSHLTVKDKITFRQRAGVMTESLKKKLKNAFNTCSSCRSTGKPFRFRKTFFSQTLAAFRSGIQTDLSFVTGTTSKPILHAFHVLAAFSAFSILPDWNMAVVAGSGSEMLINIHSALGKVSGDAGVFQKHIQGCPLLN